MKKLLINNPLSAFMITAGCFVSLSSQAAYITETSLPNDSFLTSQFVEESFFDLSLDLDIDTATGTNISTTAYHASIQGTGDNTIDIYSFRTLNEGQAVYFDIDYGYTSDTNTSFDSLLTLFDIDGNVVAFNNDSGTVDNGSMSPLDSFISLILPAGLYYIGVSEGVFDDPIPSDSTYTLHISQSSVVPVPAAAWLFGSGLIGLIGFARRKNK